MRKAGSSSIANQKENIENLCLLDFPHQRLPYVRETPAHLEPLQNLALQLEAQGDAQSAEIIRTSLDQFAYSWPDFEEICRDIIDNLPLHQSPLRVKSISELEKLVDRNTAI